MYKIKQSLDAVNYGAYFYEGRPLSMREVVDRAAAFGYDAVDIWPHRPLLFPLDWSKSERAELLAYAKTSEEVVPGEGVENWLPFFEACKEIGYDGYFAYEQCAPFLMKGHKKPTIEEIDRRQRVGHAFIKSFEGKV